MTEHSKNKVRERMFYFVELGNDIYRNQDDDDFAASGGEIFYCFDQTVFNIFTHPMEWRFAVTSFHSRSWTHGAPAPSWKEIQAQSAAIASEYLMSSQLPGQESGSIFMTPWHHLELAKQAQRFVEDFKARAATTEIVSEVKEEIISKIELIKEINAAELDRGGLTSELAGISNDADELSKFVHSPEQLRTYVDARRMSQLLVNCAASESLDQTHRIVSSPLNRRVQPLSNRFDLSPDELGKLRKRAVLWYWRIRRESELVQERGRAKRVRPPGSFWTDAQSLAYIEIVSERLDFKRQRIVLVTSDALLFDAYRRYWVDHSDMSQPFLLRKSFQFTPIFNLGYARRSSHQSEVAGDVRKLFEKIKATIEAVLIPFNLSSLDFTDDLEPATSIMKGREYLALRASERQFEGEDIVMDHFLRSLDQNWFESIERDFDEIADVWRKIERISLGFYVDHIKNRFSEDRYLFNFEESEEISTDSIVEYFSASIALLTERSHANWLPGAMQFLTRRKTPAVLTKSRVPLTLSYVLPDGSSIYEFLENLLEEDNESGEQPGFRSKNLPAELPFVLASVLSSLEKEWWRAEEFAEQAIVVCDVNRSRASFQEVLFLSAVTKRYRLGGIGQHLIESIEIDRIEAANASLARVVTLFNEAEKTLKQLQNEAKHLGKGSIADRLLLLKVMSEEAALCQFFAASVGLANPVVGAAPSEWSARKLVTRAKTCLLNCIALEKDLQSTAPGVQLQPVRDQVYHNICAVELLQFALDPLNFYPDNRFQSLLADEGVGNVAGATGDAFLNVEVLASRLLHGLADPSQFALLEERLVEARKSSLGIDRAITKQISSNVDSLFGALFESEVENDISYN